MTEVQQGLYNPEISNVAKETGGVLADIKTNTDNIPNNPATEEKQDSQESVLTLIRQKTDNMDVKQSDMALMKTGEGLT